MSIHFMKKIASLLIAAVALTACVNGAPSTELQTGDLVFVNIPDDGSLYIHTAILDVDSEGTWILDATDKRGVARYPLDTFILDYHRHDGSFPAFEVFRLKDATGVEEFVAAAKKYIGEKYDISFLPDNGKHYCTELVYDSYIRDGEHIFESGPMDFKNASGEFPAFWVRIFNNLGAEIPQGLEGTNPQTMRESAAIEYITDIEVPEKFL